MDENNLNQYDGGGYNGNRGGQNNNNGNNNGSGPGGNGDDPKRQSIVLLLVAALITLLCMSYFMKVMTGGTEREITYNEFVDMVEAGKPGKRNRPD